MLLSLFLLVSGQPLITPSHDFSSDPPVHVWLSSDGNYQLGDRAKVYARAAQGGYLVVLHATPDGRVRVLFPVDPGGDQRIQGGKKYEVKGRGGHEAFMVDDTTGHGTVVAAVSQTPFRFADFEKNGRWDYDALSIRGGDAEAGLLGIVQRMLPADTHYDFDVATYVAVGPRYARHRYGYPYPGWWGYGPWVGAGFRFAPYPFWGFGWRRW